MGWPITALCSALLALSLFHTQAHHIPGHPNLRHVPPPDVPTFQRNAVESSPDDREYGSSGLPLRSAVERVPEHYEGHRQPLRDAVEASPKQ